MMSRNDERGQAITEYVILLLVAFMLFAIVQKGLAPVFARWAEQWAKSVETRFAKNLHRFR
jgi:hypothetical protein